MLCISLFLLIGHCWAQRIIRRPFYVVAAPESAGNRLLVALLLRLNCVGRSSHKQPLDPVVSGANKKPGMSFIEFRETQNNVWVHSLNFSAVRKQYAGAHCFVVHRSLPHAMAWVNLTKFLMDIEAEGMGVVRAYANHTAVTGLQPRLITPQRNMHIVALSQLRETHVLSIDEAYTNIARATQIIAHTLTDMPNLWHRSVIYSDLAHSQAVEWFFERDLGVPVPRGLPAFVDEDHKYYENLTIATNRYELRRARTKAKVESLRMSRIPS
jgi:hypothetical protein